MILYAIWRIILFAGIMCLIQLGGGIAVALSLGGRDSIPLLFGQIIAFVVLIVIELKLKKKVTWEKLTYETPS